VTALRTYNVIALGPSGSGKTVFLSAMHYDLFVQDPGRAFYIKTDPASALDLNKIYNQIANPRDDWPQTTNAGQVKEWIFTACVNSPFGNYDVSRFRYLDYAGGKLTDVAVGASTEETEAFFQELDAADALLGILDGRKIRALLRDEPAGDKLLNLELTTPLAIMQRSRKPIQFVITKWDLLQGQYTLGEVRERLLRNRAFRNLIETRARMTKARIRLIPVSAVGFSFVEPQPDGTMLKRAGQSPEPWQVDIPLATIIPDQLDYMYESLDDKTKELLESKIDPTSELTFKDRIALFAAQALRSYTPLVKRILAGIDRSLAARVSEDDLQQLALMLERRAQDKLQQTELEQRAERDRSLAVVDDTRSAIQHLNQSFALSLERFDEEFPDSVLTAELAPQGR
jgi:hypothetical protein